MSVPALVNSNSNWPSWIPGSDILDDWTIPTGGNHTSIIENILINPDEGDANDTKLYSQLLFNQFNGDLDEILKEAENLSIQINPTDGNITALDTFKNNFNNLISSNYDSGTDIGDLLDGIETERITVHLEQLSDPIT